MAADELGCHEMHKRGSLFEREKIYNFEIYFSAWKGCFGSGHRPQPTLKYLDWTPPLKYSYKHS